MKGQIFYRPLGGVIEFGERGAETVARELKEEIGADVLHHISREDPLATLLYSWGIPTKGIAADSARCSVAALQVIASL